jgi:hypothetical protein
MKIAIAHARNVLMGWDIDVNVNAENGEKIAFIEVRVNGFPEVSETQDDPVESWEKQLTQQGVFPGDNKVEVLARDQNGGDTRSKQAWTGN